MPNDRPAPGVVTPEAVLLDLDTATVGSRAVAYLLDLAILAVGYTALGLATAILGGGGFVPGWVGITLLLLLVFAWQFGYPIGFETLWRGRTPGKAAMGLRVVTTEAAPVGVRHAAVRATVGIFELLLLLGLPAVVSSLVSPRGQRLGDLAAGTVVVRERRAAGTVEVVTFAAPVGHEDVVAQLDVSALGARDYATVRDTLRRLPALPDAATRARVAERVASALVPRVSPSPRPGTSAETWLRCVAAAMQGRRSEPVPSPAAPPAGEGPPPAPRAPAVPSPLGDPPAGPGRPTAADDPPARGGFLPPS